jgi:hypothetical protein
LPAGNGIALHFGRAADDVCALTARNLNNIRTEPKSDGKQAMHERLCRT